MAPGASPITCHVLDSTKGRPASEVAVELFRVAPSGDVVSLGSGMTNSDGRCTTLLNVDHVLEAGTYRMRFLTGPYFEKDKRPTFYPFVEITFGVPNPPDKHYHIPLLLSPYSYTTYRGS